MFQLLIKCSCGNEFSLHRGIYLDYNETKTGFYYIGCPKCEKTFDLTVKLKGVITDKGYRRKDRLVAMYVVHGMSMQKIGDVYGVSATAINKWLNKHNIPTRSRGQVRDN